MDPDQPRDPWDQRHDEKAKAYKAFRQYVEMGVGRSLRKLSERDDRVAGFAMLALWSRTHDWVDRAQAWDMDRAREEMIEQAEKHRQMLRAHAAIGTTALAIAQQKFQDLLKRAQEKPDLISVREAVLLAELGSKLERFGRGAPDERLELSLQERQTGGPMLTNQDLWSLLQENPDLSDAMQALESAAARDESPETYQLPAGESDDDVVDAELVE